MRNLEEYDWNPKTEVATLVYEDGRKVDRPAPLPALTLEQARAGYNAALLFWLQSQPQGAQ